MMSLAHHVLLVLAAAGFAASGLRLASPAAQRGLARAVAGATVAATAAVSWTLVLGLVNLGGSSLALSSTALGTWAISTRLARRPETGMAVDIGRWWEETPVAIRVLTGAALGALLAWAIWLLRYPGLGFDSVAYHLPEILIWLHQGTAGTVESIFPGVPVGSYPLTNEVLMSWAMGISGSFAPVAIWAPVFMLLLAAAARLGLSELGVSRGGALLVIAVLCLTPILTHFQMNGAHTDLPALAWLVVTGSMCAAALRRPPLLAFAVLAAGLAVGTKTTTLPMGSLILAATLFALRHELRLLARPLAAAGAAAFVVGGVWYLRNLIDHGSPFWPFLATPWGDPATSAFVESKRFIETPRLAVERLGGEYFELIGSSLLILVAGGLLVPVLARRREVTAASAAVLLSVLVWINAPLTGVANHDPATVATTRYLLPGLAAACLALALATKSHGPARFLGLSALAAGATLAAAQTFQLGFPQVPSPGTPLGGAVVGGLLALALSRLRPGTTRAPWLPRAATILVAVVVCAVLAGAASGFVERHAQVGLFDAGLLRFFAASAPANDSDTVAMGPLMVGLLAGDRLERGVELLPPRASCSTLEPRAEREWIAVARSPFPVLGPSAARNCFEDDVPLYDDGWLIYRR